MRITKLSVLLVLLPISVLGKELPVLKSKQLSTNLRYLSKDGKITYYQKRSGSFELSTNYSFKKLLQYPVDTTYNIVVSGTQKHILVEAITQYHRNLNSFKAYDIHLGDYGQTKPPAKIAQGVNSKLHLNDTWLSFYSPITKTINLHNTKDVSISKKMQIQRNLNPFFIPQVDLITPNDIFYTDINKSGEHALMHYSYIDKKFQVVYKSRKAGHKIEFCLYNDKVYVGEFPLEGVLGKSSIHKINIYQNQNYAAKQMIYSSGLPDIGNFLCAKDSIYFTKTREYLKKINFRITDLAKLNLKTDAVKYLSKLNFVTQAVSMDGLVLIPYRDKIYIADGKQDILKSEIIKEKNE